MWGIWIMFNVICKNITWSCRHTKCRTIIILTMALTELMLCKTNVNITVNNWHKKIVQSEYLKGVIREGQCPPPKHATQQHTVPEQPITQHQLSPHFYVNCLYTLQHTQGVHKKPSIHTGLSLRPRGREFPRLLWQLPCFYCISNTI